MSTEDRMSMSMRTNLSKKTFTTQYDARAASAIGQSRLVAFYEALFNQNSVNIAQVLLTKPDFYNPINRVNLRHTILELIGFKTIPIINTNDVVVSPSEPDSVYEKQVPPEKAKEHIMIHDNDALAAYLATEINADLLILMSDVDGVFNKPPGSEDARLLHTFTPKFAQQQKDGIEFGSKSSVGLGGMESKVSSALWALEKGTSVVICNGNQTNAISSIMNGKKIGTFFTLKDTTSLNIEQLADKARLGSRALQKLEPEERAQLLRNIAESLKHNQNELFKANDIDLEKAQSAKLSDSLLSRLKITEKKVNDLVSGLNQLSEKALTALERPLRKVEVSNKLFLTQVTVPIGVLLVIFESRPDSLPQIAGLSMASGNGLLLKGGKEAIQTNTFLAELIREELVRYRAADAVCLINTRDEISELLSLENKIDLVIPRGSNELVKAIKEQSKSIPVLGHADGICHVYVDSDANIEKAIKIVRDAKCDYPAACNAMETLLVHENHMKNGQLNLICDSLRENGVELYSGPRLSKCLTFGPAKAKSLRIEYSDLKCTVEVVDDLEAAVAHINKYGSSHTDVIVTENDSNAELFQRGVDSACVFHNCSSRFADGYRFGLGAEVGISTGKIHPRGPVGLEGLLTTKWIMNGDDHTVADFSKGIYQYTHKSLL